MKKIITISVIVFVLALLGIGYFYISNKSTTGTGQKGGIGNTIKNFFPFGEPVAPATSTSQTQTGTTTPNTEPTVVKVEKMFQISTAPVAGFTSYEVISTSTNISLPTTDTLGTTSSSTTPKKTAVSTKSKAEKPTDTVVRFVESATGHVYDVKIVKPNIEKSRISNNTIPKIYDAILSSNSNEFIARFLNGETVSTSYIKFSTTTSDVSTTTASTTISSIAFPANTDIVLSSGEKVFYTIRSTSGSVGFIATFGNKKPTQIFTSPLRDLLAVWSGGDTVAFFPKAHSDYEGVLSFLNTKTGTVRQVTGPIRGLTALPNTDATHFLYNTDSKNLSLASQNVSTGKDTYFKIATLPEKCVWSSKNTKLAYCAVPSYVPNVSGYPERWYQGIVSFSDSLWSINTETGEEKMIYAPYSEAKGSFDMTNLKLNNKENYIFLTNKNDYTLWGVSL